MHLWVVPEKTRETMRWILLLLLGVDADFRISMPLSYHRLNKSAAQMHSSYRARRLVDAAPIHGDLAMGYYYTYIFLGSTYQRASVILDTGSSITALPCVGDRYATTSFCLETHC